MREQREPDLTYDEAAAELNVNRKTIERLVAAGKLEAFKVGSSNRIERRVLDEFKKTYRIRPSQQLPKIPNENEELEKIGA